MNWVAPIKDEETLARFKQKLREMDEKYYITDAKLPKWTYLKGAKKIPRTALNGHEYDTLE